MTLIPRDLYVEELRKRDEIIADFVKLTQDKYLNAELRKIHEKIEQLKGEE